MGGIRVTDLGKAYKQYPSRWARLAEWVSPFRKTRHTLKWVLQDLNFTVNPGDALGVIGINGAGKSTLLKMITGTTQPTTGSVDITGRAAALLELGMGFHPEFTGRQNVLMAGQLLGLTFENITCLMPHIEDFAEIGEYIDQPVRIYSSGMQMRLAFSVATALRPDILIVDEALSVGDSYFQHKSFARIREFREQGTTLLMVSHDKAAIQSICNRAILLDAGRLVMEGDPEAVLDYYNAITNDGQKRAITQTVRKDGRVETTSGTGEVKLIEVALLDEKKAPIDIVAIGQQVTLSVKAICNVPLEGLVVGYMIRDRTGQPVFGTNTAQLEIPIRSLSVNEEIRLSFAFQANLGPGSYSVTIAFHAGRSHFVENYEWRDNVLIFSAVNIDKPEFIGVAWIPPVVSTSV
jgi:lipopolysaccharide transport system ATP-binding protein